jgi:hypothetical protein
MTDDRLTVTLIPDNVQVDEQLSNHMVIYY